MPVESISVVSNMQPSEFVKSEENDREQINKSNVQKGTKRDLYMTLGILASFGIATIAYLKNRSTVSELEAALKKSNEERHKIADELNKLKENADIKLKEALEQVKKEIDNKISETYNKVINDAASKINAEVRYLKNNAYSRYYSLQNIAKEDLNGKLSDAVSTLNVEMKREVDNAINEAKQNLDDVLETSKERTVSEFNKKINEVVEQAKNNIDEKIAKLLNNCEKFDNIAENFQNTIDNLLKQLENDVKPKNNEFKKYNLSEIGDVESQEKDYSEEFLSKFKQFFKSLFKQKEKIQKQEKPLEICNESKRKPFRELELEGENMDYHLTDVPKFYTDYLKNGKNGIIFVPAKPPKFVQKIVNLFKSSGTKSEISDESAQEKVRIVREGDKVVRFIYNNPKKNK